MGNIKEWRFTFTDTSGRQAVTSGTRDIIKNGTDNKDKDGFFDAVQKDSTKKIIQGMIISPLNTVTGGVASPLYKKTKAMLTGSMAIGAGIGSLAVDLGVIGIQAIINNIQNRLDKVEKQANQLGNTDNVLIRAGSVSQATYYTANLFGVKERTDRS